MLRINFCLLCLALGILLSAQNPCDIQGVYINALLIDPSGFDNDFDSNNDGMINSNDEFIEICNSASDSVDLSNWTISDDDPPPFPDYTFPEGIVLAPDSCIVLVANYCDGDTLDCEIPGGVLDMSLPFAGLLGNGGDVIQIADSNGQACSVSYGSVNCEDIDPLDLPGFDLMACDFWGSDVDGCPLLMAGDSCGYTPEALPVEFVDYTIRQIEGAYVYLEWITTAESNNKGFIIEWKKDYESSFTEVGWVDAHSDTALFNEYSFVHRTPASGLNYYRIKQQDYNGMNTLSRVLVARVELSEIVSVFPTITEALVQINGDSDEYLVSCYSLSGELIFEKIRKRNNEFLDLSLLHNGYYVLRVFNGMSTRNFMIFKI